MKSAGFLKLFWECMFSKALLKTSLDCACLSVLSMQVGLSTACLTLLPSCFELMLARQADRKPISSVGAFCQRRILQGITAIPSDSAVLPAARTALNVQMHEGTARFHRVMLPVRNNNIFPLRENVLGYLKYILKFSSRFLSKEAHLFCQLHACCRSTSSIV